MAIKNRKNLLNIKSKHWVALVIAMAVISSMVFFGTRGPKIAHGTGGTLPETLYAGTGLPASSSFFPIAVWDQTPAGGNVPSKYSNEAQAFGAMGINTYIDEANGGQWPESYGSDDGTFQAVCNEAQTAPEGQYLIAGGDAPVWADGTGTRAVTINGDIGYVPNGQSGTYGHNSGVSGGTFTITVDGHTTANIAWNASAATIAAAINTAVGAGTVTGSSGGPLPANSVSLTFASNASGLSTDGYNLTGDTATVKSINSLLTANSSCAKWYLGYDLGDEPDCTQETGIGEAGQLADIANEAPGSLTLENQGAWTAWLPSNQVGGCLSLDESNFALTTIGSSDEYPLIDPYHEDLCTAITPNPSPSTQPGDCLWVYGQNTTNDVSLDPGKPVWVFLETGTDALGDSEQRGACTYSTNLCPSGNQMYGTLPQINSAAWLSLINGANGIEYFCDDSDLPGIGVAYDACAGGDGFTHTGSGSTAIPKNLTYIDNKILSYAPELNTVSSGICSMQTAGSEPGYHCSNGDLTLDSSNHAEPICGMTKEVDGDTYLFVEADRGAGTTTATYKVSDATNETATLVYDSAQYYDPTDYSDQGSTFTLNGTGQFSDTLTGDLGGWGPASPISYQVKIYKISASGDTPPTATIHVPSHSGFAHSSVNITATATDNSGSGIAEVELYINNSLYAVDNGPGTNYSFDNVDTNNLPGTGVPPDGTATFYVKAIDNDAGSGNSPTTTLVVNNGDADNAGTVNAYDFSVLDTNWGNSSATYAEGDFNGDGTVNAYDFSILDSNFGWSE